MSDITEESLMKLIMSDTSKKTYRILMQIHSDIKMSKDNLKIFIECGGMTHLVQYLSKPNENILNITLGILATCCSDTESGNKIITAGIMKHLNIIMRSINSDRIQYRCCKLIMNLARSPSLCSQLISNKVCDLLAPILNGSPSEGTQLVAMRSLKHLWVGANIFERKVVTQSEVLKNSLKYLESSNKHIRKSVLQIIFLITRHRSETILKQLITDELLKQILSKTEDFPMVLRIIHYLTEMKCFNFKLVQAGVLNIIFPYICNINLENMPPVEEMNTELVLRSLYRLSREPHFRGKLRDLPNALGIIIHIIETSNYVKFKKYCVLILLSYNFDKETLAQLVKQRLVAVLISYLRIVINAEGSPHVLDYCKSDSSAVPCSPTSSGRLSPLSDSELSGSFSPSPTSERFATSPVLSLDSVYSPICSPIPDDTEEDEVEEDNEKISIDDCSSNKAESPLLFREDEIATSDVDEHVFRLLQNLMFCKSHREPIFDLCAKQTWETLLDYLIFIPSKSAQLTSLLSCIAKQDFYFYELLQSHFALTVHRKLCRPMHKDCSCCLQMNGCGIQILSSYRFVAESWYGQSVLFQKMSKMDMKSDLLFYLSVPVIFSDVGILEKYSFRSNILKQIIDNLAENINDEIFEEKVASLYSFASSVNLENPQIPRTLCKKCNVASLTKEGTVSFLLDDGSTVTANKSSICEKSDFFDAMFRCGFKEAAESVVRLSNISSDCLTVLLRLLYDYCDCLLPKNVIVLLELIVQSDRFCITDLSNRLLQITINCVLDYKNCGLIYDWAVENGSFLPFSRDLPVCHNVIKYALAGKLLFSQRVKCLRTLLKSQHRCKVLSDINQVLEDQLYCHFSKTNRSKRIKFGHF